MNKIYVVGIGPGKMCIRDRITTLQELAAQKEEYVRVQAAMESVRGCGYGVVLPEREEVQLQEPVIIRQGSKYGVKIKAASPSIHMIKANIETEIAPVVGNEQQAKDLLGYIQENAGEDGGIWQTTIFGKTVEQLVEDGIRSKITQMCIRDRDRCALRTEHISV